MAPYPGYAGSVNLAGTVKATATGMDHFSSTIDLDYQLTGAEPLAQGGIHIHTGTTCADASLVSGHYFATASDPWSTTTTYQADGIGAVTGTIAGVAAGLGFNAITDHTIVVHDSAGARIGCGVCRPDSVAPLPLCSSPGAPEISSCGDLKSVFQSNTCCGISAKPLNNSLFKPAQAMPSSSPSTEPTSQPSAKSVTWVRGAKGATCDNTCSALGKTCDTSYMNVLTNYYSLAAAFAEAGYTCIDVAGP